MTEGATAEIAGSGRFGAFRYRNYRLFFLGAVSSYSGQGIIPLALGWLVLELTDSAFLLGVVSFASSSPTLLLGFLGGVAADRVERRRLIVITEAISMVMMMVLGTLTVLGMVQVWLVIVIAFLRGTAWAFNIPTQQALLPSLVLKEDVTNAVTLYNTIWNSSRIIGPALGGILVSWVGVGGCFYAIAATSFIMILATTSLKVPAFSPLAQRTTVLLDLVEGLRYVRSNTNILALISLAALTSFFGLSYIMLLPVFARDILQIGAVGLGMLMTSSGVGALAGSLTIASQGNVRRRGRLMIAGALAFASMLVLFSLSRSAFLSMPLLFLAGSMNSTYVAMTSALLQSLVAEEYRGRVMALYSQTWGLMWVGGLPAGALASVIGAPLAVTLGAFVSGAITLTTTILLPGMRKLD